MRGEWVLVLALGASACDSPVPPVAQHQPSLDADDLAVMRGLLDDHVRPRAAKGLIESRFLVVDTTMAVCPRDTTVFGAPPGGCLAPDWLEFVAGVLPPDRRRTAALDFQLRNARRLPIRGALGGDVSYISATLTDFISARQFRRQHAGAVVTFSMPSYPAPNVAVIAYRVRQDELAAARLERQRDGRWKMAASGWSGAVE